MNGGEMVPDTTIITHGQTKGPPGRWADEQIGETGGLTDRLMHVGWHGKDRWTDGVMDGMVDGVMA